MVCALLYWTHTTCGFVHWIQNSQEMTLFMVISKAAAEPLSFMVISKAAAEPLGFPSEVTIQVHFLLAIF